jgi:succinate dehydrogenase / fumarate reductase flavoprotein subunit
MFMRQLWNMLVLARVITVGALMRDESRGSHYKPEFPERNDDKYMKTTIAKYDAATNHGPKISYEDIDASLVKPVKRDYTGKGAPAAPNASTLKPAQGTN